MRTQRTLAILLLLVAGWFAGGVCAPRAQDGIDGLRLLGRNESEFAHVMDFHVVGNHAYASIGLGLGLDTYDISDPANPVRVGLTGRQAWRAYASGDTLFSFCHAFGVQMFDISAGVPVLINEYNPPWAEISFEDGARVGDLLYVAAHQDGIHILGLTTPNAPYPLSKFSLSENACWAVTTRAGFLFIANGRFGLSVVDLSGPTEVASLILPGHASDISLSADGTIAFMALAANGVAAVDITDPTDPVVVELAATMGNVFTIGRTGTILAAGSYPYAERFDVSDPTNIFRSGWDATKVYAMGADAGVTENGDTVIVVADWRGMGVYAPEDDPAGDIDVFPTRLDFGAVATQRDTIIQVRNTGAGPLEITDIQTPAEIAANPSTFVLAAGETEDVTITTTGTGGTWGRIFYYSDDPDEPISQQFVYKNNTHFPQIGSLAPDFTMQGTDHQAHTLSDYRGQVVYLEFGANW